jgi:hypothetical protein
MIVGNWRGGLPVKLRIGLDAGPQKAGHRRKLDEGPRLLEEAGAEADHRLGELST